MSTLTKERLEQLANFHGAPVTRQEEQELARIALASLEAEAVYQVFVDGSWTDYDKQHLEELLEAKPSTLFRVAYPSPRIMNPVSVDADDNFYSWFGREWHEHYQHNQYTTAAKQMLGVMAESAWKAGRRAAMLQSFGNSEQLEPVTTAFKLTEGWVACSERMPEVGSTIMVFMDKPQHSSTDYAITTFDKYGFSRAKVTHWMPLPAAPKQEA